MGRWKQLQILPGQMKSKGPTPSPGSDKTASLGTPALKTQGGFSKHGQLLTLSKEGPLGKRTLFHKSQCLLFLSLWEKVEGESSKSLDAVVALSDLNGSSKN